MFSFRMKWTLRWWKVEEGLFFCCRVIWIALISKGSVVEVVIIVFRGWRWFVGICFFEGI